MTRSKIGSWSLLFAFLAFCVCFAQRPAFGGAAADRSYVSSHFFLELDGAPAGYLFSAEGGNAVGEVAAQGAGPVKKKQLVSIKFEEITLQASANMSKVFYQWIKDTLEQRYPRKNGAIIMTDYNYKEMSRMEFFNGLITEVVFPAADAASKEPARLQVKITPQQTRNIRSSGKASPPVQKTQKNWLTANFRFNINGLEAATQRTAKISAPTFKIIPAKGAVGEQRDSLTAPAGVEIANLTAWVAASHSEPLYQWFESFVLKGNNADNMERLGTLEYFDPSLKQVLFKLTFDHLGIFKLSRNKVEAASPIAYDKAEMYMENMRFDYSASW